MSVRRPAWGVGVALGLVLAAACAPRTSPERVAAERAVRDSLRAQALIDSGNVAFAREDWAEAARRYSSAVVTRPDDPAAYYGLGMALQRLGRDEEARVAFAKSRELSRAGVDDSDAPHEIRAVPTRHP
ncbi:MAG: Tetratricopeptide repeat [Candidatus Eisenbacteria bacterium]